MYKPLFASLYTIYPPFRGDEIIEQLPESLPGIGTIQGNDTVSGWWEQNTGKYVTEHLGQVSDWKYSSINKLWQKEQVSRFLCG